jgi:hypothetical protein
MLDRARILAADPDRPNLFATDHGAAIPTMYAPIPPEDRDPDPTPGPTWIGRPRWDPWSRGEGDCPTLGLSV